LFALHGPGVRRDITLLDLVEVDFVAEELDISSAGLN